MWVVAFQTQTENIISPIISQPLPSTPSLSHTTHPPTHPSFAPHTHTNSTPSHTHSPRLLSVPCNGDKDIKCNIPATETARGLCVSGSGAWVLVNPTRYTTLNSFLTLLTHLLIHGYTKPSYLALGIGTVNVISF
jgi:hypothetical protein